MLANATSGYEPRVVANSKIGCEPQVVARNTSGRVFGKLVYELMSRPGKKTGTIEFLYTSAIFSYNFEADPLS